MSRQQTPRHHALRLELRVPPEWKGFVLLLHIGAGLSVLAAAIPLWARSVILGVIGASLVQDYRRGMPLCDGLPGLHALTVEDGERCRLESASEVVTAQLEHSSVLWTRIDFLRINIRGRRSTLVLPAKAAFQVDSFRRLQVLLRAAPKTGKPDL